MRIHWAQAALAAAVMALGMEGAAVAAPVLIDDFASRSSAFYIIGTPAPPFFPNAQPVEESGLPTTIGEERDTLVEVLGTPNAQSAQFLLGVNDPSFPSGVFHLATAGSPASVATLQYDGDDADGASLTNAQLLDFAVPANGWFEVDFLTIDAPGSVDGLKVDIHLTSIGGGTASYSAFAPETATPADFVAPLASFTQSVDFDAAHISSVTFVFNSAGLADADFTVDNLRAVPEPAAISLAAVACLAVFAGLRRKRA